MNERQLGAVMVVLMASIAVGFLFVLFRSPPEVAPRKRLADVPAEQAAGTMGGGRCLGCFALIFSFELREGNCTVSVSIREKERSSI